MKMVPLPAQQQQAAAAQQMTAAQAQAMNMAQRNLVLANCVKMKQRILSTSVAPANQNVLNVAPRNVGLIMGFLVEVIATVTNGATTAANLTPFGTANMLTNITFTDLNNQQRINTKGWHMALLNSARQGFGFGGVYSNSLPIGYGNNFNAIQGPATLAANAVGNLRQQYWVPLSYGPQDLRGGVYAGVVSATMNLGLTINPTPFVAATDPVAAVYSGNAGGVYTGNVTVNVYQVYLDQLPMSNGIPVLPFLDMNTVYDIKTTTLTGIAAGNDFPVAYPNFRDFLSTIAVYDNAGVFNGGTDVNYWSLTSANFTNIFNMTPTIAALDARQTFMADPPLGTYYFDHRAKPLSTLAAGNMELNLNASAVTAGASLLIGFESFAQISQLTGVGGPSSLPAG